MISIGQIRLLESRVIKAIEYVDRVTEENTLLKNKLDSCQKRIDELEVNIQRFKEDQGKIEEGIISALDRLNQFEDDMDKGISMAKADAQIVPQREETVPVDHQSESEIEVEEKTEIFVPEDAIEPTQSDSPELGIF
ncbi:MAG: cell division protein ZapB [Spirochaetaceae bacterium]|jgi:FtsZ-binding cell division protein ZapB|nr:cell division protein ZapB [Spirochaetaceae bacterium]